MELAKKIHFDNNEIVVNFKKGCNLFTFSKFTIDGLDFLLSVTIYVQKKIHLIDYIYLFTEQGVESSIKPVFDIQEFMNQIIKLNK